MTLLHTPLYAEHQKLGANFTDFGGWQMPLRYGSELDEHHAVRKSAGLFDLSHMGEIWVEGPDAAVFLNTVLSGNLAVIAPLKAKYSLLLNDDGGIVDDLITYRLAEDKFLVVPNASNAKTVFAAMQKTAEGFNVTLTDATLDTALVAIQGPNSVEILAAVMPQQSAEQMRELKYYAVQESVVAGCEVLLARTGYTGEDGFEIYAANADSQKIWQALLEAGAGAGLIPAGLAARDSLRLEAGMPLYGNELGTDITPPMVGLAPVVSFKKTEDFVGRRALEAASAPSRVLVGLQGLGKRAGRGGYNVLKDGEVVGLVTSGLPSPTLGYPIALALVDEQLAEPGTELEVDLRGKPHPFKVVSLPFYKRAD